MGRDVAVPIEVVAVPIGVVAVPIGVVAVPIGVVAVPIGVVAVPIGVVAVPIGVVAVPIGVVAAPIRVVASFRFYLSSAELQVDGPLAVCPIPRSVLRRPDPRVAAARSGYHNPRHPYCEYRCSRDREGARPAPALLSTGNMRWEFSAERRIVPGFWPAPQALSRPTRARGRRQPPLSVVSSCHAPQSSLLTLLPMTSLQNGKYCPRPWS
jgi:hypothetical protein